MKYFLFLVVIALVHAQDEYTKKYDKIDIDSILNNPRLVDNYVQCLIDKGRCTEDGKALKGVISDALATNCNKCSDFQRAAVDKVLRFLINKRKDAFDKLTAKYDPDGVYRDKYKQHLEKL